MDSRLPTYIAYLNDSEQGPYTFEDLVMYEQTGDVSDGTQVRRANHDVWLKWSSIKAVHLEDERKRKLYAEKFGHPATAATGNQRSRMTYILLGLFFGCLGIHNFYAGYTTRGVIQLVITLLLGWIIVGVVVTGLWSIVEICTVREDALGHPFAAN
jgi:TM2 domain-containing membrane protein YozV